MKTLVLFVNASGKPEFHSCDPEVDEVMNRQAATENADMNGFDGPFIAFTASDPAGKQLPALSSWLFEDNAASATPIDAGEMHGTRIKSALAEALEDLDDADVFTARWRIEGALADVGASLPKADLELLLEMARSHIDDIDEGLSDGTYLIEDNTSLGEKRRVADALEAFLSGENTTSASRHLVVVEGDVEPFMIGPFASEEAVMEEARRQRANDPDQRNGLYWLDIRDGTPAIGSIPGGLLDARGDLVPYIVTFRANNPESAPRFLNHYACSCGNAWEDRWDSACDDECGQCAATVSPHQSDALDVPIEFFRCEAEDAEHADEQARNAYPDAEILGATPAWLNALSAGDEVVWNDPDQGIASGTYLIQQIATTSGRIEHALSAVKLRSPTGDSVVEAFAVELKGVA